jgi:hypothetical protein
VNHQAVGEASVEVLVAAYRRAASAHGKASVAGDHRTANKHFYTIAAIYRELRKRGRDCQLAILPLLTSDDLDVRAWAAAHSLEFSPSAGRPVLEELAKNQGIVGLEAQMTLREWQAGRLTFP